MERPMPLYPAEELVMRSVAGTLDFKPSFTGTIDVYYTLNGADMHASYSTSGINVSLILDPNTDVRVIGTVTSVILTNNLSLLAISNTVTYLTMMYDSFSRGTIDFRNAISLNGFTILGSPVDIAEVYVSANDNFITNSIANLISQSIYSDGALWINRNDTYAATVISAAEAKGWTVYDL